MTETASCPFCEGEVTPTAQKCRHCGEWISRDCLSCGTPIKLQWAARGYCAECGAKKGPGYPLQSAFGSTQIAGYQIPPKNRSVSVVLALVLGGFGAHKFYLDKPGKGLLYTAFCWTGIPTIVGLFEAVKYIRMDEEEFALRASQGDL